MEEIKREIMKITAKQYNEDVQSIGFDCSQELIQCFSNKWSKHYPYACHIAVKMQANFQGKSTCAIKSGYKFVMIIENEKTTATMEMILAGNYTCFLTIEAPEKMLHHCEFDLVNADNYLAKAKQAVLKCCKVNTFGFFDRVFGFLKSI